MKTVAFAYACGPGEGSEPGAGWTWARLLAHFGQVWVITRTNNREAIEAALPATPERDRLHFIYVDLPSSLRRLKRGSRGIRVYYLVWQVLALRAARELARSVHLDTSWHLTFANFWLGSTAFAVGGKFVFGPVGGGVRTPFRLALSLGSKGLLYEMGRSVIRSISRYLNPLCRLSYRRASLILVQNADTRSWIPRRHRNKCVVFPNAVLVDLKVMRSPQSAADGESKTAIFAGRLLPLKGVSLALRAIHSLEQWRLLICGSGPDTERLQKLAHSLGMAERVEFLGWLPRSEVIAQMSESDLFLFPSLHDEAGWAVAEAVAVGLPVVCLDLGGAPVLAGSSGTVVSSQGGHSAVVQRLTRAIQASGSSVGGEGSPPTFDESLERLSRLLETRSINTSVEERDAAM